MKGSLEMDILKLSFETIISDFWKTPVFISHAGQSFRVMPGVNAVVFKYIPTEQVYFGTANCRYKGRAIDLDRLLREI